MRKIILTLALLFASVAAYGQSVQQSGSVTAGHAPYWVTNGVIGDAGTASDSPISSFGVTNNGGPAICASSGRSSAAGRQQLCLSASLNGGGQITLQNYGTATAQPLQFVINGSTVTIPSSGGTTIPTITTPLLSGNIICANGTTGALVGCTAGTSGQLFLASTGAAPGFATMSGDASITNAGIITVGSINGVVYGASPSTNTVPVVTGSNTVTYEALPRSAMATIGNNTVLGNTTGITAVPSALTATQLTTLCNAFSSSLSGCAPSSGGGTANILRADGAWTAAVTGGFTVAPASGFIFLAQGSIVSPADGVFELLNAAGTGFTRVQLGGTTASFPAIKRNSTAINLRLADDSADAPLTAGATTITGSLAAPATTITGSFTATGLVGLGNLATQATNTALVNATSGPASPTAQSMPSCSAGNAALTWTTNTGFGCATITSAATSIAVGTTTVTSGTNGTIFYQNGASPTGVVGQLTTSGSGTVVPLVNAPTFTTSVNVAVGGTYQINSTVVARADTANSNYYFGPAGNLTASGNTNTGVGVNALTAITTGSSNVAIGQAALIALSTSGSNTAVGVSALNSVTTGTGGNIGIGLGACSSITTGSGNICVGVNISGPTTGTGNLILGGNTGIAAGTSDNVFISTGSGALTARYNSGWTMQTSVAIAAGSAITSSGPGGALTATAFVASGLSTTKTVRAAGGGSDCTLIFTSGTLTGGSC